MVSREDPSILWVAPHGAGRGRGSFDEPYTDVTHAVSLARPGDTVVLTKGRYHGDVTVQARGTIDRPVRIAAERAGCAEFVGSCWYVYDICDVILSGVVFRDAPHVALSVVGACERNCFDSLRFFNCGTSNPARCTVFLGGSGARCNVVENCVFEAQERSEDKYGDAQTIGIMISEGDTESPPTLNRDHIVRQNAFHNYDSALLVGTRGSGAGLYGHVVENNIIRNCRCDGVRVKCGDVILRANLFQNCRRSAVSLAMGKGSTVADNRIECCATGIHVLGCGHTVRNNCILHSSRQAVHVCGGGSGLEAATNVIIENNTCVNGGGETAACVRIDPGTSCVIRRNLFSGPGRACVSPEPGVEESGGRRRRSRTSLFADDNLASNGCDEAGGCSAGTVAFADEVRGNYENQSGYGAQGWMARGTEFETPSTLEERAGGNMEFGIEEQSSTEELLREIDSHELLARSLLLDETAGEDDWLDEAGDSEE